MNYTDLDLAILKSIINNKRAALDFTSECDSKLFSTDVWNFAKLITSYIKTYKDIPTLRIIEDQLAKGNNEKQAEYVRNLWKTINDFSYDEKQFKFDLTKLKSRYAEKQIAQFQETISNSSSDKIDVAKTMQEMQKVLQNIKSLTQAKTYERKTLKEAVVDFREEYNAKLKDPNFDRGVLTGYSFLDMVTDGLRDGEMLLIGGESGAGKSMFLMNIALQIWLQKNTVDMTSGFTPGHNILYFSLEMPVKPCRNRVLSRLSGVPSKLLRNPVTKEGKQRMSAEERDKLRTALLFIKNYPSEFEIIDVPRGCTVEQVEMLFEEAKLKYEPRIIVVDYLGIMDDDDSNNEDDWLKLGFIAGKLHELARVHNLILLSAVQLNRAKASKDAEEKIGMHRVGRSALIMHHANIGVQIETRQNEKQYPDMHYHVIKNRDGEQGKGKLIKNLSCGTLLDDEMPEDDIGVEFTDLDDISDRIEFLDI